MLEGQDSYDEEGEMQEEPDFVSYNPLYESVAISAPPAMTNELHDYLQNAG